MTDLDWLSQAERMLADLARPERELEPAQAVADAANLRDFAEAARVTVKQGKLGTAAINLATVTKLCAEWWIARYVDAGQAAGQIADIGRPEKVGSPDLFTYGDLGLTKQQVHEARVIKARYSIDALHSLGIAATRDDRLLSRDKIARSAGWKEREDHQGRYANTTGLGHADVLLIDPPWRYAVQISDARAIENQYPTMTYDDLAALDMPAGEQAVLFCWATAPQTDVAIDLLRAWEFEYKTNLVWVKDKIGMGYYVRGQHELLLIATRGAPELPAPADRPSSVITAPRLAHSAKPDQVYDLIDRMYPNASKRELFARHRRDGWLEPWGLDVPEGAQ